MAEQGNLAHIYRLGDGNFRLTFISTSPSGAQFLSEIGDFTRWELDDWLKDGHLNPSTDFDALLDSFENQTESSVPLVHGIVLRTHFEDEDRALSKLIVKARWLSDLQEERYFGHLLPPGDPSALLRGYCRHG